MAEETNTTARAERAFRRRGGMLRTSQALKLGIHPRTLYEMRDANRIVQLGRGLYRLADYAESEHIDLITVMTRLLSRALLARPYSSKRSVHTKCPISTRCR